MPFSVGVWSWKVPYTRPEWWTPIVGRVAAAGMHHWLLKIVSDDAMLFNGDHLSSAVKYAQAHGVHVWGWGYCRDARYVDPEKDGDVLGARAAALEMNGVMLDVEREWDKDDRNSATKLVSAVRGRFSGPVWASSYSTVSLHSEFPYTYFNVDGWTPQVYQVPQGSWARRSYSEFKALAKDVILTGIGSTEMGGASDTMEFLQMCKTLGVACNLWEYSQMSDAMWQAVRTATGVS